MTLPAAEELFPEDDRPSAEALFPDDDRPAAEDLFPEDDSWMEEIAAFAGSTLVGLGAGAAGTLAGGPIVGIAAGSLASGASYRGIENWLEGRDVGHDITPTNLALDTGLGLATAGLIKGAPIASRAISSVTPQGVKNVASAAGRGAVAALEPVGRRVVKPTMRMIDRGIQRTGEATDRLVGRLGIETPPLHHVGRMEAGDVISADDVFPRELEKQFRGTDYQNLLREMRAELKGLKGKQNKQARRDVRQRYNERANQLREEQLGPEGFLSEHQGTAAAQLLGRKLKGSLQSESDFFLRHGDPLYRSIGQRLHTYSTAKDRGLSLLRSRAEEALRHVDPEDRAQNLYVAVRTGDKSGLRPSSIEAYDRIRDLTEESFQLQKLAGVKERITPGQAGARKRGGESGSTLIDLQHQENYLPELPKSGGRSKDTAAQALRRRAGAVAEETIEKRMAALGRKSATQFSRRGQIPLDKLETDIEEVLTYMVGRDADLIAKATAFGAVPREALAGTAEVGKGARAMLTYLGDQGDDYAKEALEGVLRHISRTEADDVSQAIRAGTRLVSNALLARSFMTQWGELMKGTVYSGGVRSALRGRYMTAKYPHVKQAFEHLKQTPIYDLISGPEGIGLAGQVDDLLVDQMDLMRRSEGWLRTTGAHAGLDMLFRVAEQGAGVLRRNGAKFSRRLTKEAKELFPEWGDDAIEKLAREFLTESTLSQSTIYRGVQGAQRRWFYNIGPGMIPHWMRTPVGAAATQYRPFLLKAMQQINEDVFQVVTDGIRHGDKEYLQLGLGRLARSVALTMPLNVAVATVKAATRGRLPSVGALAGQVGGSTFGWGGDLAQAGAQNVLEGRRAPLEDLTKIPLIQLPAQIAGEFGGGLNQLGRGNVARGLGGLVESTGIAANAVMPGVRYATDPLAGILKGLQ